MRRRDDTYTCLGTHAPCYIQDIHLLLYLQQLGTTYLQTCGLPRAANRPLHKFSYDKRNMQMHLVRHVDDTAPHCTYSTVHATHAMDACYLFRSYIAIGVVTQVTGVSV